MANANTKKDPTAAKRQRDLIDRNEKRGLVSVRAWVPADKREEMLALAAQWRAEAKLGV